MMRKMLLFLAAVISVLLLPASGDLSARTAPARVSDPASVPVFQKIVSFGDPSPGASPVQLMRGADGALYGTASGGGSDGSGTVFRMNPDGSGFTVLANLVYFATGANPHGRLVQGSDGTLYGTASTGGSHDSGTIFKLGPDGSGFQSIVNFDENSLGGAPLAGLTLGSDGVLYGTASEGGSQGYGTVFRMNTDGSGFLVLKSFNLPQTGGYLHGELLQGTDGALYGTATQGGSGSNGTVFKLNTNGSGFAVIKSFAFSAATTGAIPEAGLVQGTDGALYGTASAGGVNGYGVVYKLNTNGTGFLVIKNFDNAVSGGYPYGALSQGSDGALYGTATEGGSGDHGTVFKLNPNGSGFAVLENFDGATTGGYPLGVLVQGAGGVLYGVADQGGGGGGGGTVFSLSAGGSGFAVLKPFPIWPNVPNGGSPQAGLMQGADGALYGTASNGGSVGAGTVFRLNPDGSGFTALASLDTYTSGYLPVAPLVQGADGTLYGTTSNGGGNGYGTLFSLDPQGGSVTVLEDFDGVTAGGSPYGGLILGTDGRLYGTTSTGGSLGYGTVFSLAQHGGDVTVLLNLDFFTTGGIPMYDGLVQGSDGALYGTAYRGGTMGYGTVFKLNPDGSGFEVLLTFDGATTGGQPFGGLLPGADGALYGTTSSGGSGGQGSVFKLNPDGSGFMVVQNFDLATTGGRPFSGLVQGSDGTLYGTTNTGGAGGSGTVFQMNPDGSGFQVLQSFDAAANGGVPIGRLMWGADGNLYGTTWNGGDNGVGTIFRLVFAHGPCDGKPDGAACDDGDGCTTGDACRAGACVPGAPVTCGASDQCHDAGVCDPATGACSNPAKSDGSECNDGNACTHVDTCQAGACVGSGSVSCTAVDQCHDAGVCDPGSGVCSNPAKQNGAACNDGNACTQVDTCQAGACVGASPVTCAALDQCHMPGSCNAMTGACTNPARKDGTACNDGNACTRSDACQAGACVGGNPVICTAPDGCHDAGVCDTGTGVCSSPVRPDGSACSDADACTQTDVCESGVCQGTNYSWSGVLSPINADGSSIFKLGSTVPVKFKLTGACDGRANVIAHLYLAKYSINIYGTELETVPKNKADVGITFRSDSSGNYSFNLDTSTLSRGTWLLRIDLGDGVPGRTVLISLK